MTAERRKHDRFLCSEWATVKRQLHRAASNGSYVIHGTRHPPHLPPPPAEAPGCRLPRAAQSALFTDSGCQQTARPLRALQTRANRAPDHVLSDEDKICANSPGESAEVNLRSQQQVRRRWESLRAGEDRRRRETKLYRRGTAGAKRNLLECGQISKGRRRHPTLAQAIQALPSAMRRLTAEFGMGSGRTTALWSPKNRNRTDTQRAIVL